MTRARCGSCRAEIIWARTVGRDRMMPLDAEPHPDGNIRLIADGFIVRCELLGPLEVIAARAEGPLRRSHFATCPNSSEHRRPR